MQVGPRGEGIAWRLQNMEPGLCGLGAEVLGPDLRFQGPGTFPEPRVGTSRYSAWEAPPKLAEGSRSPRKPRWQRRGLLRMRALKPVHPQVAYLLAGRAGTTRITEPRDWSGPCRVVCLPAWLPRLCCSCWLVRQPSEEAEILGGKSVWVRVKLDQAGESPASAHGKVLVSSLDLQRHSG